MKRSNPPLLLHSLAKLNLYLRVLNKRRDNFHNLSTLFCRIDLADTIILKERKDGAIKIKCKSRQVPKDKNNLCHRAAALLKQEFRLQNYGLQPNSQSHKLTSGIEIEIKKRIPVGAGLGGGSSNAASVLLGLNKYWSLNLSKTKLVKLAAELGSDVPFFVACEKFALGSRRGEEIRPLASLKKLKLWFILVCPDIKVSTPLIYSKFDRFSQLTRPEHDVKILISELSKNGFRFKRGCLFNSLEPVTTGIYPVVDQVKKALYGMGLEKVMMSGSGPAVFAICDSQKQAGNLSARLRKKYKSWQVFASSAV